MEKMVRRLANKIAVSLGYDEEREAVVAYGLLAIVQIGITIILALIFGFIVGAPVEAMIVCFAVSIFRKYSGGAHAYDADFCTVVSVIYCTVAALASRILATIIDPVLVLIVMIICYMLTYWIIYRYVPIDSPNKPITNKDKIKRMRKGSTIIVSVYFALQLVFYYFASRYPAFHSYGTSLLLGTAWQSLTLTPLGAILLNKLNDLPKFFRKEAHL